MMRSPMYRIVVKESKEGPITSMKDMTELIGPYFVDNHRWKIHVTGEPERIIMGPEFSGMLKKGTIFISAAPLEGDQILFRITAGESWIIHTTRRHWMEFFQEKTNIIEKTELDTDLPEFSEFMQD